MAKPLPPIVIPPSAAKTKHLSYATLRALWINAGGDPAQASRMASIALSASAGNPIDPWGVGAITSQGGGVAPKFKTPQDAAKAAVSALGESGQSFWASYLPGAAAFYKPVTPAEKTAAKASQAAADANNPALTTAETARKAAQAKADASNATLAQERADISIQTKVAQQTAHLTDPWMTITKDSSGNVTGFGESFGSEPPADVLLIGGQPATKSLYQQVWGSNYENVFESYTGNTPTAAQQAQVLSAGTSVYALQQQLANQPGFTGSPIYQANAAGIADQAKQVLGSTPPASFVRDAIAGNWDANTISANLKALPAYQKGPVFQQSIDQAQSVYAGIYGAAPDPAHADWLKNAALQGWSTDEIGQKLRADPAYTASPEFASKAYGLLTSLGLPTTAPTPLPPLPPKTTPAATLAPPLPAPAPGTPMGVR